MYRGWGNKLIVGAGQKVNFHCEWRRGCVKQKGIYMMERWGCDVLDNMWELVDQSGHTIMNVRTQLFWATILVGRGSVINGGYPV